MKRSHWFDVILVLGGIVALAAVLGICPGCHGPAKTWTGGVISCATGAVRNNWARAYPEVQSCLISVESEPITCLDAIPALVSVGVDVVACIVRGSGQEAASQANANPNDYAAARKAERANMYLIAKGFAFQE